MKSNKTVSILFAFLTLLSLCALSFVDPLITRTVNAKSPTAPAKCYDAPVTSVLNLTGDITQSTNYRVEGDGLGPYFNGVDSVSSIIQGANCTSGVWGDWELDASNSPTRKFLIDLRQPVPNTGAQQIFAYQYVPARVIVMCGGYAIAGGFPALSLNQTVSCAAFVRFAYGSNSYRLAMTSGPNVQTNYPETNNVLVSCTATSSSNGKCIAWTVYPTTQPGGSAQSIARLEDMTKGAKQTNLGDFYTSFLFNVTNP
ncbi:MAG TPA: hypothetical protein VIX17_02780 [Pyrinomonadaceae bacterium]|jgi:hypothetical protein